MAFKRALLSLLLLLAFGSPLHAQAFGPDGVQTRTWNLSATPGTTGAVPADAYEPADVADSGFTANDWVTTFSVGSNPNFRNAAIDPGGQRKMRFLCRPSTEKQVDNILFKGVKNAGHRHQATGNVGWDENSTFTTLRNDPNSTCAGGPHNSTNYVEPSMLRDADGTGGTPNTGIPLAVPPYANTFYYVGLLLNQANDLTWLRRNTAFILGTNPKDFNDTARRAEYAAAGLLYPGGPDTHAGWLGWQCLNGSGSNVQVSRSASRMKSDSGIENLYLARHLKSEDGQDPWGGLCSGTEASPATLVANLVAPPCWDGHNLESPDGRAHFAYAGRTGDSSVTHLCPQTGGVTWPRVPELEVKTEYRTLGWSEYQYWYLASDRMRAATTECPDPAAPCDGVSGGNVPATISGVVYSRVSKDPCRAVGLDFCNTSTMHADWRYGWRGTTFDTAQRECLGIAVRGISPVNGPADCNSSTVSATMELKVTGASPNSALSGGCATIMGCAEGNKPGGATRYVAPPPGTTGTDGHFGNHGMAGAGGSFGGGGATGAFVANDNQVKGAAPVDFDLRRSVGR